MAPDPEASLPKRASWRLIKLRLDWARRFWALSEVVLMLCVATALNAGARRALRRPWLWLARVLFRASETLGRGAHRVYEIETRRRGRR
jgi:hypothetical protein